MAEPTYKEYPSGKVLCCLRHDHGAIVCLSDSAEGDYDKRAQEARDKVNQAYVQWSHPVGKMIDTVV